MKGTKKRTVLKRKRKRVQKTTAPSLSRLSSS